uniref:Uncharacterized protein n=1 Tax=Stegastes partitus TaxID=144197 RepID=A0A3B5A557_9TELE
SGHQCQPKFQIPRLEAKLALWVSGACVGGAPSGSRPVLAPSRSRPVLTPSRSRPVLAPSRSCPVLAPSRSRPVLTPSRSRPVLTPSRSRPVLAPSRSRPVLAPSRSRPVLAPSRSPVYVYQGLGPTQNSCPVLVDLSDMRLESALCQHDLDCICRFVVSLVSKGKLWLIGPKRGCKFS